MTKLVFPNGSKYVGDVKDGKANGKGTHTWDLIEKDGFIGVGFVKEETKSE